MEMEQMKFIKKENTCVVLSILSIVGAFLTWSETTKRLPQELSFYKSWIDWIWMIIPIFTIFYSYKNKESKSFKKNIIIGLIATALLFFGGLFAFVPNDKVDYKEILKYENVLQLKLPKTGILVYEQSSDINNSINDLTDMTAYYNKKVSIKDLDKQIKNSKVWINKKDLDKDLNKQFPLVVKMNDFDDLYVSFYNTDTKQYNTKIEASVNQHVILTVYCKRTRSISLYEYTYDNHSK